ncbi:MAG TPA: OmpA family protein [Gammaproteobacteria bacterium]|nr:OmpA family protein [Gammaproteobacteria bacterium]
MNRPAVVFLFGSILIGASAPGLAQTRAPQAIASSDVLSQISMFSYREGKKSSLNFRGTPIAANALGEADVQYEDGNTEISAQLRDLPAPGTLGPYTTYVLWALTPDGRAVNQGVIGGHEGGKGEIETEYGASQFALIVTAEPHFAVSAPSTMIALYNVADEVEGTESKVTSLTESFDYSALRPIAIDEETSPAAIVQAKYAVAIADSVGARQYAPESYAAAAQKLGAAETAAKAKKSSDRKAAADFAREAVIASEDARRAAMAGAAEARAEGERRAAAAAAAEAERVRSAAENASKSRLELLGRLDAALPTRVTERGLVSEIGGVQFATGTADLSGPAREALARFSGIVASYPGLRFNVEGHTDNVGSATANNELSLRRAIAVRDYLISQGVAASTIDVAGLGSSRPAADNSTADGRAKNRRIEIVVSGGPLGAGGAVAAR